VPRFGAKSASAVLARFGHVEAIPDDVRAWGPALRGAPALAASIAAHRRDLALWKRLTTLRTDVPLAETLDDLEWRGARRGPLTALTAETDDADLLGRVSRWRDE
jgi:hypothetical protein